MQIFIIWHYHFKYENISGGGEIQEEDLKKRNRRLPSRDDLLILERCLAGSHSLSSTLSFSPE
jgi:hypothetical protein